MNPSSVHLAHHWWVSHRGGERVFEEIAGLFPGAAISTLFLRRETLTPAMAARRWVVSPLGRVAPRFIDHRKLLLFYPWAVRQLRVPADTRLLISSDAALIKGLRKPSGCVHVCYCYSPPRYLWDLATQYEEETSGLGGPGRWLFRRVIPRLRVFDQRAAAGVDHFVVDSRFIGERVLRAYGREATVIYPGVELGRFAVTPSPGPAGYYLAVAELVAYKRIDLAVRACSQLGRPLVVAGAGPERARLEAMAGATVRFVGRVSDSEIAGLIAGSRALLHPQVEDFGITALESQAAGRPVIAFRAGGALETVIEGKTGLFFDAQTPESLAVVLQRFDRGTGFCAEHCRAHAERFSPGVFRTDFRHQLEKWGCSLR